MAEIIKIYDSEQLKIVDGEIIESEITNTNNILMKNEFDGNINTTIESFEGIRVLWVSNNSNVYWNGWFNSRGAILSSPYINSTTFLALNNNDIVNEYDIVLFDYYVWAVSSSEISKGKELADLGMVVCAAGNDTTTNVFVLSTGSIGTEISTRAITMPSSLQSPYTKKEPNTDIGSTGGDPNVYISSLNSLCTPLYYHSHVGENGIMGYIYESENGGSLFFDETGYFYNQNGGEVCENIVKYQLSRYFSYKSKPTKIRYIRDYLNGSTSNIGNHWVEIQAIDEKGVNRALGIIPTGSTTITNASLLTDGNIATNPYTSMTSGLQWIKIDLGAEYNIKEVKVWHWYGDDRSYYDTRTQVSKDDSVWVDIFNSANEGTYQEPLRDKTTDTGQGRTYNLIEKNNNISYVDYGIPIEDSFDNLEDITYGAYGLLPQSNVWGGFGSDSHGYVYDTTPHGYLQVGYTTWTAVSSGGIECARGVYQNDIVSPSTEYTISVMVKPIVDVNIPEIYWINIYEYDSANNVLLEWNRASSDRIEKMTNGWYRIWATWSTTSTTEKITYRLYSLTQTQTQIRYYGLQLVKRNTISPIYELNLNGVKNKSYMEIELPSVFTYGTIIGKFIPRTPWDNDSTYSSTLNQSTLLRLQDDTNDGGAYLRYYVSGGVSQPFLDPDGAWGYSHIHQPYTIDANKEITYVIQKQPPSTLWITLFQDGIQKPTYTYTDMSITSEINRLIFGNSTIWNGTHTSLTVHKDIIIPLSDVANTINTKMSLKNTGNMVVNCVDEVGENLWPNYDLTSTSYTVRNTPTVTLQNDVNGLYHQVIMNNNTWSFNGYDILSETGETYIVSGWFWQSTGNTFIQRPLVMEGTSGIVQYTGNWSAYPKGEWFFAWGSCVSDGNIRILVYLSNGTAVSGTAKWRNISVRKATPSEIKLINDGTFQAGDITEL